jgi:hypothetical protein
MDRNVKSRINGNGETEPIEGCEEENVELSNKCLGIGCKVRLPRGEHFCKNCKIKKDSSKEGRLPINDRGSRSGDLLSGIAR